MKRLLILGAGSAQLNLVKAAEELGYYVIVCDTRETMEASKRANKYYKVDYMNRDEILEIAKNEKVDGVISNSEPAMRNVAFISEKLNLPGNTEASIDALLSKYKFREIQKVAGVFYPEHYVVETLEELDYHAKEMNYPIVIKPVKCSGSRGTTKLYCYDYEQIAKAFNICAEFSRDNHVEVEEFVEMNSLRVNDADIFVIGDEILWDGWLWEDRSKDTPMLPMTEIYPMNLPEKNKQEIKDTVTKIIKESGVRLGEYNVETYYTKNGEVFVIEINPRQAGNYIPQLIEQHTGVSLTKLLVSTAVNDMSYYEYLKEFKRECNYVTLQVVFAKEDGIYEELYISPEIEKYIKWIDQVAQKGDIVEKGVNASKAIAYVDMEFDTYETQHKYTDSIEEYIYPVLR